VPLFGPELLNWAYAPGATEFEWTGYVANLAGCLNVLLKGVIGVTVMMWVRWTLPRLRIDQVMTTCLKYCTPIAAVMFLGAALWTALLPGGIPGLEILQSRRYGEVREALPPRSVDFSPREKPAEPVAAERVGLSPRFESASNERVR
jgi:hypothetical protein